MAIYTIFKTRTKILASIKGLIIPEKSITIQEKHYNVLSIKDVIETSGYVQKEEDDFTRFITIG